MNKMNRRRFIGTLSATSAGVAVSGWTPASGGTSVCHDLLPNDGQDTAEGLHVATFDVDVTPPPGSFLVYNRVIATFDQGLRAKGFVLFGAGQPVVLCAVDWISICNESQDVFKQVLSAAAHTTPDRVIVHTLHQHDAPISDFTSEKILRDAGIDPGLYDGAFDREALLRISRAVEESAAHRQPVTHLGVGSAPVYKVASNRRILNENGKVRAMRWTACPEAELRALPEGLIDPELTLLSFWNRETPLVVLTCYASHPQSYYRTGIPCPDFPGIARYYRQLAVPDALHIHLTGAGGNIGAGKYNDGAHENRLKLARRLADGMERAWKSVRKTPLTPDDIGWETLPVVLPTKVDATELQKRLEENRKQVVDNLTEVAWTLRQQAGNLLHIAYLRMGTTRTLFMPGELFVEYQLAAKNLRRDLTVLMAAYCEGGPGYIGTREACRQGGYEIEVSPVTEDAEDVLMAAIGTLLKAKR